MPKLAILLYGIDSEKEKIEAIKNELQSQLNQTKDGEVDVVYYTDQGEESDDFKKNWLLEQTKATRYVFVTTATETPANFIIRRLNAIKFGATTEALIELDIFRK